MIRLLFSSIILLICWSASFADTIQGIRVSQNQEQVRLVFDLDKEAEHKMFTLANPDRLVVDFKDFKTNKSLTIPSLLNTPVKSVRYAQYDPQTLRVVLDLHQSVKYEAQTLAPNQNYPHRLVIDLMAQSQTAVTKLDNTDKTNTVATPQQQTSKTIKTATTNKLLPRRDIVIAIDAGHGGQDSGALGHYGTKEKTVVLAISQKLAKLVNNEPGMRAYLTRDKDIFISLRERIRRARENGADMFISIHADAFHNTRAKGSSVYVLSERGASSEAAKILADRENAADLAGGISLEDKEDVLATVLLDLSQEASLEGSLEVGNTILSGLKRIGHVHKKQVESAAFVVLKSPDIPSVLVETAFISNPEEEKKLRSGKHQTKLAQAMMVGIRNYFQRNPLPGTNTPQQHIVSSGDTLSTIAQRYQVSMADIKNVNNMKSSTVKIGEVLKIP